MERGTGEGWWQRPAAGAWLAAGLTLLFYAPLLRVGGMQGGGDFANLFWPGRMLVREAWSQGTLAFWNPYAFLGAPFAATLQHAVFYPPDWVLLPLLPVDAALGWMVALHLALCGAGMALLLAAMVRCETAEAGIFGAALPCCGWFWGHTEHVNQVACAAWMPWVLWAAWHGAEARDGARWRWGGVVALLTALQWLAGHPQAAFHTHLLAGPMALALSVRDRRAGPLACYAAGTGAGLLLAAVPLSLAAAHAPATMRAVDGPGYPYQVSLVPAALVNLLVPHPGGDFAGGPAPFPNIPDFAEYRAFLGPVLLALAVVGALRGRRDRPRLALFLTGAAVGAVLLALGGNASPLALREGFHPNAAHGLSPLGALLEVLPPARGFRVPARFLVMAMVALVALAALGWRQLPPLPLAPWARNAALLVAVLGPLAAGSWGERFRHPVPAEGLREAARLARRAPAIDALDRRVYRLTPFDDEFLLHRDRSLAERARHPELLLDRWERLQPAMPMAARVATVDGYEEGLAPPLATRAFLARFNRNLRSARPDTMLLALMGVATVWTDVPVEPEVLPVIGRRGGGELRQNPHHRGAAFWVAATEGVDWEALNVSMEDIRAGRGLAGRDPHPWGGPLPRWHDPVLLPPRTEMVTVNELRLLTGGWVPDDALLAMGRAEGWRWRDAHGRWHPVRWRSPIHAEVPREAFVLGTALLRYHPPGLGRGVLLMVAGMAVVALLLAGGPATLTARWRRRE